MAGFYPSTDRDAERELIEKWKPIFEAQGIDPRRIPLDDFAVYPDRVEYTYLVGDPEKAWAARDVRSERRTLPVVTEVK